MAPNTSSSSSAASATSAVLQHIQSHRDVPVEQLFTRLDIVGKGAYGAVYKGIHNATGTILALKVINLDTAEDDIIEIQREVALLSQLRDSDRHNCIGYHGCYFYKTELWIAMDFASGGSIRTLLKPGKIEEKYSQLIVRETLIGLNYLHRQDIIHRDIKSANILLTNAHRVLLCDFGIAAPLQSTNHKRSTFIGTPYWMAPEVIADGRLYDTKADIWSLGITLYEMLNGNPPYSDLTPAKVILKIPRSQPAKLEGNQFSNGVKEFLAACLIDEPHDRPAAEELMKHKWIKSISKAPLTPLKDLTNRYTRWVNSGGIRQSLAGASSTDSTVRPESINFDKSDWDFMDDATSHDQDLSGDSLEAGEHEDWNTPKDGAVTVRPTNNNLQMLRQARPHRLMKLFEEDHNNHTPSMGMFGGYPGPFQHSPNIPPVPSPIQPPPPMIGLGFQLPGMPAVGSSHFMGNGDGMEPGPPTISIPSTEELDMFLETPMPTPSTNNTNPNRPFSPAAFNRSTTPTPTNYQRMAPAGALINSNVPSSKLNKSLGVLSPLLTPTIGNLPFSMRTDYNHDSSDTLFPPSPIPESLIPSPSSSGFGNDQSSLAVSTSPSLPNVPRKEPTSSTNSRNRANTAPANQDNTPIGSTSNTPALPSTRPTYGGGGKQFGGNGFSFGGPSSSSSSNNASSSTHLNGTSTIVTNSGSTTISNGHLPSPSSAYINHASDRAERAFKNSCGSSQSITSVSAYHHPNPPPPPPVPISTTIPLSNTRLRSGTETGVLSPLSVPSKASSSSTGGGSVSASGSGSASMVMGKGGITVGKWPKGVVRKRELNYHMLTGVKEVKNELEDTLSELSEWLESCETGLGMLIEALK